MTRIHTDLSDQSCWFGFGFELTVDSCELIADSFISSVAIRDHPWYPCSSFAVGVDVLGANPQAKAPGSTLATRQLETALCAVLP